MTKRDDLKKRLQLDYSRAPKVILNQNKLEMVWSDKEKIYIGHDKSGEEWIAALQNTSVPIMSVLCPLKGTILDGDKLVCHGVNIVPITNSGSINCRKCKKSFTPEINIPKSSSIYDLWNKLDDK